MCYDEGPDYCPHECAHCSLLEHVKDQEWGPTTHMSLKEYMEMQAIMSIPVTWAKGKHFAE